MTQTGQFIAKKLLADGADRAFSIARVNQLHDIFQILVYEGPIGVNPLIFDLDRAETRTQLLEKDKFVAEATHVLVNPNLRRAVVEYVRRGAKADDICQVITEVLKRHNFELSDFEISFSPVVSEKFVKLIQQFLRIRAAEITVTRPNSGWTDHYTALSDLIESSDGDKADLGVRAARGRSLKKSTGVVKLISDVASEPHPYLRRASITGVRQGEEAETTLSTAKHITHSVARVSQDMNGRVSQQQILHHMDALLRSKGDQAAD